MRHLACFLCLYFCSIWTAVDGGLVDTLLDPILPDAPEPMFTGLQYGSYYKGAVCQPAEAIRHPKTTAEVVSIVQEAIANGKTVKAIGFQHSATDIICTSGIPVSMMGIGGISMNADQSVTVGAGVNMYTVTKFLRTVNRGLKTTPAFGNITIGGAIGTGAHGSSIKYPSSISEQVIGVEIVNGLGQLQNITDAADLQAFRIHLGLLGIVTKVTLKTSELYKVHAHNYVVSDEIITNGSVIDIARNSDQVSIYWFPSFGKVVIANWTILEDVNTPGTAWTNDHVPSTYKSFNFLAAGAIDKIQGLDSTTSLNVFQAYMMRTLHELTPDFVPIYTEDGVKLENPAVGYYDDMFAPICNSSGSLQCPWFHGPNNLTLLDNEIAIELEKLPEFAVKMKDILSKYPALFVMQGILLRFSAATNTFMSESQGRDTCHFEFYMSTRKDSYKTASSGLAAYQAILQTLAFEYNGRSHWGKTGMYYHTKDLINMKMDPQAKQGFISKMNQFDPNEIFMNSFGRRLKGEDTKMDLDPQLTHCALLDNCVCSADTDCAPGQVCSNITGYENYPVCKTPGHSLLLLNPNPVLSGTFSSFLQGILDDLLN